MLRKLREFAQENPWANRLFANPKLVAERLQGYDGAEDTPPATHINRDEHSVSVTGSWHWTLVQGTQRQEGPKR